MAIITDLIAELSTEDPQYFRHTDGGIYQYIGEAISTENKESLIVYYHIWPFAQKLWARPKSEWTTDRFAPITSEEAQSLSQGDQKDAQGKVAEARFARKGQRPVDFFTVS